MLSALLILLQTAPAAEAPPSPEPPARIDLTALPGAPRKCSPANPDNDILICGSSDAERYRLRPLAPRPGGAALPPATVKLGDGTLDVKGTQRTIAPGVSAPAAMATIKLPF